MRPAVTVIPESFSPSRLMLPMGSTLAAERQPVWVCWHALLAAPPSVQGGAVGLVQQQRAIEALFRESCRALCLTGEARADVAAHEIARALSAEGLLARHPAEDLSDGRRLSAVIAVDRAGRWSVARLGATASSMAVVFQAPQRPVGVLWLDEPGELVELPGAAEPQAFVAFERRDGVGDDDLRTAFTTLVEQVRELMVPPGTLGGLRLPLVALGQGLPLLESRLIETNEALVGVMVESQQALSTVNDTVRPLARELRGAVDESSGVMAAIERARRVLEESSEEAQQHRAALLAEVTSASEQWARTIEGLEEHRLRTAQGMDGQLALVAQSAAQLAETAGRVNELGSTLDGSLLVLRDTAGEVLEALERKATGIEALLVQTESLEHAVSSATRSVVANDARLREQTEGLAGFQKVTAEFVRRLEGEARKAEAMTAASARMDEIAGTLVPLRDGLADTLSRVDTSMGEVVGALQSRSQLFEQHLAESRALSSNLEAAVSLVVAAERALRERAGMVDLAERSLGAAAESLWSEARSAGEGLAAWRALVEETGASVRRHLAEHDALRARISQLDEAAHGGAGAIDELQKTLASLGERLAKSGAAVESMTASIAPSLEAWRVASEGVERLLMASSQATEAVEAARLRAPELDQAITRYGVELDEMTARARAHQDAADTTRTRLDKVVAELERVGGELVGGERGVGSLVEKADEARARLSAASEAAEQVAESLRHRDTQLAYLVASSTLAQSETRIAESAVKLEALVTDGTGQVEAWRAAGERLRGTGDRVEATAREIEGTRESLTRTVKQMEQRLVELRGIDPRELLAEVQPRAAAGLARLPLYAGGLLAALVASTVLILLRLPSGGAPVATAATPRVEEPAAPRVTPSAAAPSPAAPPPAPAPAPAAAASPAPAAARPAGLGPAERRALADHLKAELDGGLLAIEDRDGEPRLVIGEAALFTPATAKVTPPGRKLLDALVRELKAMPARGVVVSAFTDRTDKSTPDKDMALSLDRAWHVGDYLGSQGLDKALIAAAGYGELLPVADNADAAARPRNRRVEITFLPPQR